MAVPGRNEMLVPFLRAIQDGQPRTRQQIQQAIIAHFKLTENDLKQRQSNNTLVIVNHMAWCDVDLTLAGFVTKTVNPRGSLQDQFVITERGAYELANNPDKITVAYLRRFRKST